MEKIRISRDISVKGEYDVIVAGGGVAGVAAAVSARRMGKRVLLIEKTISLGGLATIGLVNLFVPMCNGRGTQIIKGMAEEFLRLSIKHGYDTIPSDWADGEPGEGNTNQRYLTRFSVPIFIMELTKLIKNEGVDILFDTIVSDTVMDGKVIKGLIVENKSGASIYKARMIVDATGDADVLYRAGVPTVQGGNYDTYYTYGTTIENCKNAVEKNNVAYISKTYTGGIADLYGHNQPEGKPLWLGTTGEDVTQYIVENHMSVLDKIKDDNRKERDILIMPSMPQFRTTRHIDGDYTFTTDDEYKHFDDSVGAICDFDRSDFLYEIPYRTITKKGFPNVITAGRIASGEGYGWDILRVIPPAIISAQAAGIACSIAIDDNSEIAEIDIKKLQKILESQNVLIHFDDKLVPEDKENSGKRVETGHI